MSTPVLLYLFFLWICGSEEGLLCDEGVTSCDYEGEEGTEKCTSSNLWISSNLTTKTLEIEEEILCYLKCEQMDCDCVIYFHINKICSLVSQPSNNNQGRSVSSYPARFSSIGTTNVARNKTVYTSSVLVANGYSFEGKYAVDGELHEGNELMETARSLPNQWMVVDLGQEYVIKSVKIMNRIKDWHPNRFRRAQVLAGNTLDLEGNLTDYRLLGSVLHQAPAARLWHLTVPIGSTGRKYRYVAVKKTDLYIKVLQIVEMEVLV